MKQYYVTKNSKQLGPFAEAHIEEKVNAGELSANDLCWTEGMEEWQAVRDVIGGLFSTTPETDSSKASELHDTGQEASSEDGPPASSKKTAWQKISSWPGAIYFALSMILVCLIIPSTNPQFEEKFSWIVEAFLLLVQMAAMILSIQAIISARKKSPPASGMRSISVRVLSGILILMLLVYSILLFPTIRVGYLSLTTPPT